MGYHYILSEHKDDVAYITINRPEKLNALNKLTIQELSDAIKKADRDTIKCIILTGSGPKAFVAGADIKEFSHLIKNKPLKWPQTANESCLIY